MVEESKISTMELAYLVSAMVTASSEIDRWTGSLTSESFLLRVRQHLSSSLKGREDLNEGEASLEVLETFLDLVESYRLH